MVRITKISDAKRYYRENNEKLPKGWVVDGGRSKHYAGNHQAKGRVEQLRDNGYMAFVVKRVRYNNLYMYHVCRTAGRVVGPKPYLDKSKGWGVRYNDKNAKKEIKHKGVIKTGKDKKINEKVISEYLLDTSTRSGRITPVSKKYHNQIYDSIKNKVDLTNSKKEIYNAMKKEYMSNPFITEKYWYRPLYFTNGYSYMQISYSKNQDKFFDNSRRSKSININSYSKERLLRIYDFMAITKAIVIQKKNNLEELLESKNLSNKVIKKEINKKSIRVFFKEDISSPLFKTKYHEKLGHFADIRIL